MQHNNKTNKNKINMKQILIKNLKRGNLLRLNNDLNSPLLVRSEYDRTYKQYKCYFIDSAGNRYPSYISVNSDKLVWINN